MTGKYPIAGGAGEKFSDRPSINSPSPPERVPLDWRHDLSPALLPESGNSYKLALMLTLCGQAFEPVWTDFGGGITRTPQWRATVNEMGEIPVLEDGAER